MSMSIGGVSGMAGMQAMTGASPAMPPAQKMTTLFNQIDASGTGSISKSQFEQAFQSMNPTRPFQKAGVEAVWNALDPNGSGSVSKTQFVDSMTTLMKALRQADASPGVNAAAPSAAQSVSNSRQDLDDLGSFVNKIG